MVQRTIEANQYTRSGCDFWGNHQHGENSHRDGRKSNVLHAKGGNGSLKEAMLQDLDPDVLARIRIR